MIAASPVLRLLALAAARQQRPPGQIAESAHTPPVPPQGMSLHPFGGLGGPVPFPGQPVDAGPSLAEGSLLGQALARRELGLGTFGEGLPSGPIPMPGPISEGVSTLMPHRRRVDETPPGFHPPSPPLEEPRGLHGNLGLPIEEEPGALQHFFPAERPDVLGHHPLPGEPEQLFHNPTPRRRRQGMSPLASRAAGY